MKKTKLMKKIKLIFFIFFFTSTLNHVFASGNYSNNILVIPKVFINDEYKNYLLKKGKVKNLEELNKKMEVYNNAWQEGIASSMYDATPYIFSDEMVDEDKNKYIYVRISLSKKNPIISISSLKLSLRNIDLENPNDIRRIFNMLDSKLEANITSDKKFQKDIFAKRLLDLKIEIKNHTLYYVNYDIDDDKNLKKINQKNIDYLNKNWKYSPFKVISTEELDEMVLNGTDTEGIYLYNTKRKPQHGMILGYSMFFLGLPLLGYIRDDVTNYILSTNDEHIMYEFKTDMNNKSPKVYKKFIKELDNAK